MDAVDVAVRSVHLMSGAPSGEFAEVFAPRSHNREAVSEPPSARLGGPQGFQATAAWLRRAFEDLSFDIADVVHEDEVVVTYGTMSGRHTGDFVVYRPDGTVERAFAPTGRAFRVRHVHFLRVRDELVWEHWAVRDDQDMALQLGWVPPSPLYLLRCARATARARRESAASA